jgi:hypothetical protein
MDRGAVVSHLHNRGRGCWGTNAGWRCFQVNSIFGPIEGGGESEGVSLAALFRSSTRDAGPSTLGACEVLLAYPCATESGQRRLGHCHHSTMEDQNGCAKIFKWPEIRQGSIKARRKRHASPQKGHLEVWKGRKRRKGQEPEASNRDRPIRSAEKGRESSAQTQLSNLAFEGCSYGLLPR